MAYLKDDKPEIELIFKDKGFADIKGNIREDLITKEALSIAKYFKS